MSTLDRPSRPAIPTSQLDHTPKRAKRNHPTESASQTSRAKASLAHDTNEDTHDHDNDPDLEDPSMGDLKDLEILFGLWKGAGRNVNLWDWLQGYQNAMDPNDDDGEGVDEGDEPARISFSRKKQKDAEAVNEDHIPGGGIDGEVEDEAKRDRVHASFVRFCEEARMLGLVRARGKGVGRRADEVVKGITLV